MYLIEIDDGNLLKGPDDAPLRFRTLKEAHDEIESADACGVDTVGIGVRVIREPISEAWEQHYE